jgi:predicted Zn finger-like uncharacterized protein
MIVTCPSCNARYKIPEAKIKGRGAKITCPNCAHKFVVFREGEDAGAEGGDEAPTSSVPKDILRRDFRKVGLQWKVRKGIGLTYDFYDLQTLRAYLEDGQVDQNDVLSFDARTWMPLKQIKSLEAHFWDVWQRAERGEIKAAEEEEQDEEDDSDAPTTLVGGGSSLADEIRKAVHDAQTPAPASERDDGPPPPKPRTATPTPAPMAASMAEPARSGPSAPAPSSAAPAAATHAAPAAPDPFTNLGQKAQTEQKKSSGGAIWGILAVVLALLLLLPVVYLVFSMTK